LTSLPLSFGGVVVKMCRLLISLDRLVVENVRVRGNDDAPGLQTAP